MQHVLRCWERQSDDSEYKKTLRRTGLRPGPRWESLQRSSKPPSWWGGAGCPLPKNPIPPLSAHRASPLLPHSKISFDAVADIHPGHRVKTVWVGSKVKGSDLVPSLSIGTEISWENWSSRILPEVSRDFNFDGGKGYAIGLLVGDAISPQIW